MEASIQEILTALVTKFPLAMLIYMGLTGLYLVICSVAAFTKTTKDDELVDRLKVFFSIPIKR